MNREQGSARRPRLIVVIFLGLAGLIALSLATFFVWALWIPPPGPIALAAMESNDAVSVSSHGWLEFSPRRGISLEAGTLDVDETSMVLPKNTTEGAPAPAGQTIFDSATAASPETALILYPGARVDYRDYAPLARAIAAGGHLVVVCKMPLNLAVFKVDAALEVMQAYPSIHKWVIGGHSLGGLMAAQFVHDYLAAPPVAGTTKPVVTGLLLFAARSPVDISAFQSLKVLTIMGDQDGIMTPKMIEENRHFLPISAQFITIAGANHANFAADGDQPGDKPATIPPEAQRKSAAQAAKEFLR